MIAGYCKLGEKDGRDWNAVETKCLGLCDLTYLAIIHKVDDSVYRLVLFYASIHQAFTDNLC
ncbi:hypothetical protein ES703_65398 [subsurface metagenome]